MIGFININFNSFDEYLSTLSQSSRESFRRKFRKIARGPKFDLEMTNQVGAELSAQMHELYMQSVKNSEYDFEELRIDSTDYKSRKA